MTRIKTKQEFEEKFGKNWRNEIKYNFPSRMDYIFGRELTKDDAEEIYARGEAMVYFPNPEPGKRSHWVITVDMITGELTKEARSEKEPMFAGISFDIFKEAIDYGFYYIGSDNEIHHSANTWIFVGNSYTGSFIKTRNTNGYNEHSFDCDTDERVKLADYGKTWALTKEELDKKKILY